jgi:hypothetical protein|tara:strand:+ start:314 stop:511 length:198 start_codon:yes stop_codon:yes gene_type:complete
MSNFTDPMAALEEAEYLAKEEKRTMCVVEVEPNMIVVVSKREALNMGKIILETCVPFEENFNVYD